MRSILVIGSSNTDMVVCSERLPRPGETVLGGEFFMNSGGKGANQAIAARRLGAAVTFITKLGDDMFGDRLQSVFMNEGIDTSGILIDENIPSGIALINVDKSGENSISVAQGSNGELSVFDVEKLSHLIDESELVLVQLEIPIETVTHVIKYAKQGGKRVILNPAPAANLSDDTLKGIFAITPNETEAELLTGIAVSDEKSAEDAANVLHRKGVENVVITMGSKGAYLSNSICHELIPAIKVEAVDTTAAGDVFNGAFAAALSEDYPIYDAVKFASRAAAIAVTRMGAQSSAPYRNELI